MDGSADGGAVVTIDGMFWFDSVCSGDWWLMSSDIIGVSEDLSYDIRSLEVVGEGGNGGVVIGGSFRKMGGCVLDAIGVSIVSISFSIVSIVGNGVFRTLRRLPLSSSWLILVGKRSVGGDIVIAVVVRFSIHRYGVGS